MKIIEKAIKILQPYENNPRINDAAVSPVAESIKQFGFKVPIIIDSNNVIVCGHTRYKAAEQLELEVVPCIVADDLTNEQIKAFRLADNKTAELAGWDFESLHIELAELSAINFDMEGFGFEIDTDDDVEIIDDDIPEIDEESEPVSKQGDIWQLGEHRLLCGDSTSTENIEKLMNGCKADLIVTDPPYNVDYTGKTKDALQIQNDKMADSEFQEFLTAAFAAANNVLNEGRAFYIWHSDSERYNFQQACNNVGWKVRQCLIWVKNSIVLGRQDYQWKHEPCLYGWKDGAAHYFTDSRAEATVINEDKPLKNAEHPTMKPINLLSRQVKNSSKKNEIVLDMFGGSGSTLITCEQLSRICYTAELDPKYCDVIIKRWENLSGKRAVRL